ncbi:MAG: hypothetical protein HON68_09370 [Gammaproteobacteria bacterium]|nr:hypothetical protein [Gammaproteobacteria bacterium]MBT3489990.1 hypothetical protein [Gammaproteobacteria bacterium]MBT3718421.1 hypothetical protein [Gammaproteobacteria bacterium]MBT3845897.1 hypothetical protein [Gammaproteobacteria bacterium]MBT3893915.1 hypothetical protein [Gammaproteobacteria bacterium]
MLECVWSFRQLYWVIAGGFAARAASEATLEAGYLTAVDDSLRTLMACR